MRETAPAVPDVLGILDLAPDAETAETLDGVDVPAGPIHVLVPPAGHGAEPSDPEDIEVEEPDGVSSQGRFCGFRVKIRSTGF